MNKQLFITVSCLLLFAASGVAQQEEQQAMPTQEEFQRQMEPHIQDIQRAFLEGIFRRHWDNQGPPLATLQALGDPVVREAWGISGEQWQQMEDHAIALSEHLNDSIPEPFVFRLIPMEEGGVTMSLRSNDPNVPVAEVKAVVEKIGTLMMNAKADAMDAVLTPEQRQRINESQLANMDVMPLFSSSIFEALGLTDAQREQLEQIKKALEPEFEKTLENWVNGHLILEKKMNEARKEGVVDADVIRKKLMAEDLELKKMLEEIQAQGRAFAVRFRIEMFDVLTDEQWLRLQNLIDNPPEHALAFRNILQEQRSESDDAEKASGVWEPGPNSWRPGDGIPEQYRQERNTRGRFPRAER